MLIEHLEAAFAYMQSMRCQMSGLSFAFTTLTSSRDIRTPFLLRRILDMGELNSGCVGRENGSKDIEDRSMVCSSTVWFIA